MRRMSVALVGLAMWSGACGGDDDGDPMGPIDGDGTVTATVSGSPNFQGTLAVVATFSNGAFALSASQATGTSTRVIQMFLANVTATGVAYSLSAAGNAVTYSEVAGGSGTSVSWVTNIAQGSGTVTFSKLTATEVVGNFSFDAPALTATGATGTKTIIGMFTVKPSNPQ